MPLDTIFVNPRWGQMSLRWALIHMIGEYAGHTGRADLIREGSTGGPAGGDSWPLQEPRRPGPGVYGGPGSMLSPV